MISFAGQTFVPRLSGALYWPDAQCLIVSDLHLGKSLRYARQGRGLLPPYEGRETLARLAAEITALRPRHVISLGDSFDDLKGPQELPEAEREQLHRLVGAQDWTWIRGNHDPLGESQLGGQIADHWGDMPTFRHIRGQGPDISGHLHPVYPLAGRRWRCFVVARDHLILPAFGTYTGGLAVSDAAFQPWAKGGTAILCGDTLFAAPLR